jgi:hypothetical protein
MYIKNIWNATRGFIFEDNEGKTWCEFSDEKESVKNKLLYTFYDDAKIKYTDKDTYTGPEYIIEMLRTDNQATLTIARQKQPSKKIFVFTKFQI